MQVEPLGGIDDAKPASSKLVDDAAICAAMRRLKIAVPSLTARCMKEALLSNEGLDVSASKISRLARTAYDGLMAHTDSADEAGTRRRRPQLSPQGIQTALALEPERMALALEGIDLTDPVQLRDTSNGKLVEAYEAAARHDFDRAATIALQYEHPGNVPTKQEMSVAVEWFRLQPREKILCYLEQIRCKKVHTVQPKRLAQLDKAYPPAQAVGEKG